MVYSGEHMRNFILYSYIKRSQWPYYRLLFELNVLKWVEYMPKNDEIWGKIRSNVVILDLCR